MKFKLVSDLHLEFYVNRPGLPAQPMWTPTPTEDDENTVLLLPGDIHVGTKAKDWLKDRCMQYHKVVYLLGNHEFYGQELDDVREAWRDMDMPENFHFLDDNMFVLDTQEPIRIIGGTLWTEVTDPFNMWNGPKRMTDYEVIKRRRDPRYGELRGLTVDDTNVLHKATVAYFKTVLETPFKGKTLVMTHHLPHEICVANRFKGNMLNDFFRTDLDYMFENFDIDVWVHGHTHDNVDEMVHGTRILCNPMGYHGRALNCDFDEVAVFDL